MIEKKINSSSKGDCLGKGREKSTHPIEDYPEFSDFILGNSRISKDVLQDFGLAFFSGKDTNDFEIGEAIGNTIKKCIPILVGF